ncbi:MAG: sensor histidine kinase [Thermacetogeniaceae bacterium]
MADYESLDRVVRKALAAVIEGQDELFSMAETGRSELEQLQLMLDAAVVKSAAVHEAAATTYIEPNYWKQLEQERNNLVQMIDHAGLLMTRLDVALQYLQGVLPEADLAGDRLPRKQVGQLVVRMLDNERRRIAREIHDGPAQILAHLLFKTVFCEQQLTEEPVVVQNELLEMKKTIRSNLRDIRRILFDLQPKNLDQGLVDCLRRVIDNYQERYGLQVTFTCLGQEQHLSGPEASTLIRIVQEALNNVYKHSCSDRAVIKLELERHRVTAHIRDDGKGFDLQSVAQNNGHYGLMNMRERVCLVGGSLQISAVPGQGTEISVTIPIEEGDG